jgi:DNA polymerase elongation subunit (family B)
MQDNASNRAEPKIILWDLETLTNLKEIMKVIHQVGAWPGRTLKADLNSIICFGYKVFGEKKASIKNAWDFKGWKRDINDDYELVKYIRAVLADADAIVTFNGKRFDLPVLNTRLMIHGLDPLHEIPHVDACQIVKRKMSFFSNRMKDVALRLTQEEKMDNGGWQLWVDVANRIPKAMKIMSDYCVQDVVTLEAIFKKVRPFVKNIPNYNIYGSHEKPLCPSCGSTRLQKHGFRVTKTNMFQRYHCQDCGSTSSVTKKSELPRST